MDERTKQFLNIIGQLESSGGINTAHRTINSGVHKGDTAYGTYGLMPNTVSTTLNRLKKLNKLDDTTAPMATMPKEQYSQYMSEHPEAETNIANFLARNLLARMNGDSSKAAYAWNNGSELQPSNITPEMLQNNQYVKRYNDAKKAALLKLVQNQQK